VLKVVHCLLQTSATVGALKEELNNILLSCLAEEAKRAHAAQEAIEVCRAAGTEHACLMQCMLPFLPQQSEAIPHMA